MKDQLQNASTVACKHDHGFHYVHYSFRPVCPKCGESRPDEINGQSIQVTASQSVPDSGGECEQSECRACGKATVNGVCPEPEYDNCESGCEPVGRDAAQPVPLFCPKCHCSAAPSGWCGECYAWSGKPSKPVGARAVGTFWVRVDMEPPTHFGSWVAPFVGQTFEVIDAEPGVTDRDYQVVRGEHAGNHLSRRWARPCAAPVVPTGVEVKKIRELTHQLSEHFWASVEELAPRGTDAAESYSVNRKEFCRVWHNLQNLLDSHPQSGAQGDWIAVSDRLPADEQEVLVFVDTAYNSERRMYQIMMQTYCEGEWETQDVTHWQPLPAPPHHGHSSG